MKKTKNDPYISETAQVIVFLLVALKNMKRERNKLKSEVRRLKKMVEGYANA